MMKIKKGTKMEIIEDIRFTHDYWVIVLPCICMLVDVITGYLNAWIKHEKKSTIMREGLGHKVAELAYIVIGIFISLAFNVKPVGYFISIYIIYMEILSITENCKKLGLKPPKKVEEELNKIKESDEDGDNSKSN